MLRDLKVSQFSTRTVGLPLLASLLRVSIVFLALLCGSPAAADTGWETSIGTPSLSECPPDAGADPGTDPGIPGFWWNPKRGGVGWEFYFTPDPDQIFIVWLTYDGAGRPVWLSNAGSSTRTLNASTQEVTYSSQLYRSTSDGSNAVVGEVRVTFLPTSVTQAVVRWRWFAIDNNTRTECVYNYYKSQASGSTTSSAVNETYAGGWGTDQGWSYLVNVDTTVTQQTLEHNFVTLYDVAGQPVWLQVNPIYSPTTAWITDGSGQVAGPDLLYAKSKYATGYPLNDCTEGGGVTCVTRYFGSGTFNRTYTSSALGQADLTANVSASTTGSVAINWPNVPYLVRGNGQNWTAANRVSVSRLNCKVIVGTLCAITVSWTSANTSARVYRRSLVNNQLSTTALKQASQGVYVDDLPAGSDVRYEMRAGTSTGALLYTSPEVKVTVDPATVPSCDSTTAPGGTSPVNGTYRLTAYGVTSAQSVSFSTWWMGSSNGADMNTQAGTYDGNGQWHADVDLSRFDPGAPRYGAFGTFINLVKNGENTLCATIGWSRPTPPPSITSFSPPSGPVGVPVTLVGTNFSSTLAENIVKFNGAAAIVTSSSPTSVTATVPAGATTGPITNTVNGQTATSATSFVVVPAPTLTGFSPQQGAAAQTVTLTGTNFSSTPSQNVVKFNGTTAVVTAATSTSLMTTVPAGATSGPITVTVNGQTATNPTYFIVVAGVRLDGFSPGSGAVGATVTLTGANFSLNASANAVTFNGTAATVTSATSTNLTVMVPVGATTGPIRVTVAGVTATSATSFTVLPSPPSPPTSVSVPGTSSSASILVTWAPSANPPAATFFKLQRATVLSGPWSDINTNIAAPATTYSTSVPTSGTYYFQVAACTTAGGCSGYTASNGTHVTIQNVLGETFYFHHTNMQGSVVATSDAQGYVIAASHFRPFGSRVDRPINGPTGPVSSPMNQLGYTGKWHDNELQLDYFGARYYDSLTGRFLSIDPNGFSEGDILSFNRYAYANNNPTRYVDPDAHQSRDLAYEYRISGARAPTRSPDDWLGPAIGVALGAVMAPVAWEVGWAAYTNPVATTAVVNGVADAVAAEATGGASLAVGAGAATTMLPSAGGVVRQFEQAGDAIYYRVFSDNPIGRWLTAVPPRSSAWAQEALALPPSNKATMIQEVLVPDGTLLERSRATPMPQWNRAHGGAEQFELLEEIPTFNFGEGRPLR